MCSLRETSKQPYHCLVNLVYHNTIAGRYLKVHSRKPMVIQIEEIPEQQTFTILYIPRNKKVS